MFNYKSALNLAFTVIILSISANSFLTGNYFINAILAVSYILHWRKGIFVYFEHDYRKKSKLLYSLYLIIFVCIIAGSINYSAPAIYFISFSIAFLCALPALFMIKNNSESTYKKKKILLDIIAFSGFIISWIGCIFSLLDVSLILLLNILGHAIAIIYILRIRLYHFDK